MMLESIVNKTKLGLAALGVSAGLLSAPGCGESLEQQVCTSQEVCDPSQSGPHSASIGGVPIMLDYTKNGKVEFYDGNEDVTVTVRNEKGDLLDNTAVLYFNLDNAEVFQLNHPDYPPQLEIAAHNSSHEYSLTPAPLQALHYDGSDKERSYIAAKRFASLAESSWDYYGCRDKNDIKELAQSATFIFKQVSRIFSLGVSDVLIDQYERFITSHWEEDKVGHVYGIIPAEHGFGYGTASMIMIEERPRAEEIPNNGIDDDCDGVVDDGIDTMINNYNNMGGNTTNNNQCSLYEFKNCFNDDVFWYDDCGDPHDVAEYCDNGCENAACIELGQCDLPSCVQHGANSCDDPCINVSNRCVPYCETDKDCAGYEGFRLQCTELSALGSQERGCMLVSCESNNDCNTGETCMTFTEYIQTPSGAEPIALAESIKVCYKVQCP